MRTAFKEWAVVCEALGNGMQSVIIRKGGIAEGRAGFAFRHSEFFLFPTWFHEQLEKTTLPRETHLPEEPGEEMELRYTASVEWSGVLTDWKQVAGLQNLHVLQERVVEERYQYSESRGVHVAFVRVYRLEPPVRLKNEKRYGGCRSWIDLPEIEGRVLVSVISDEEHLRRKNLLAQLLSL
ncbi:MAG TPA: DUF1802 family protein [Terrimicrobiaceae bacterium]